MDPVLIIIIGAAVVLTSIIVLKLHPVISLLLAGLVTAILTSPDQIAMFAEQKGMTESATQSLINMPLGKRLATAFGNTSGKIGLLIALASIIGTALMRSGGAERIIRGLLKLFGKNGSSVALLTGSFTLAIPVFFDTVFYLMIPLVKSIGIRNRKSYALLLMVIIAGGVMAHSLIPPTPGPLFVAEEMGIDLGAMIIGGLVVGIITIISGYFYAVWANRRWPIEVRDTEDISVEELEATSIKKNEDLPSLWFSFLPILLPLILITGNTFSAMALKSAGDLASPSLISTAKLFSTLGDANIALLISALLAMILLWRNIEDRTKFKSFITESLTSAGIIILITASGGVFGQMMQQTGIGVRVGNLAANYQMAILPMAFLITAAVRSAQGSATVAMVTAIGVMSGLASGDLAFHPVYLAMAIGCGSKIFAWMNDSAFWIITKMGGLEVKETIRYFSFLLMVMAISGLISVMILSQIFPFA